MVLTTKTRSSARGELVAFSWEIFASQYLTHAKNLQKYGFPNPYSPIPIHQSPISNPQSPLP
ncbi:MAG: hypothetical protein ACRCT1_22400 [Microcoleaceae cyanobacterium]